MQMLVKTTFTNIKLNQKREENRQGTGCEQPQE